MKKFNDITDFSREGLREILNLMTFIKDSREVYSNELDRKSLATLFYAEDENTRLAFNSATTKLGGNVIDFKYNPAQSLKDAVMSASAYSDCIAISHTLKGAARAASLYSLVPVINAGDGGRAFPVKTLADFSAVWIEKRHVSNLKIGFLGDFSNNVLVKNLLQCLNLYKGNEFYFISVNGKPLPEDLTAIMDKREKDFQVFDNLFDCLGELDVLYMTQVNKSMFDSEIMFEARKHNFILDERMLLTAKPDLSIFHRFPRGIELDISVDDDPRARYFDGFNRYIDACIASFLKVLGNKAGRKITPDFEESTHDAHCGRADCITSAEKYLPSLFYELADGRLICKYCGAELKK